MHPTIYAAKQTILQIFQRTNGLTGCEIPGGLIYIDLHAHAVKQGCFMFGNGPLKNPEDQLANQLLPRLISLNCLNFDYVECSF